MSAFAAELRSADLALADVEVDDFEALEQALRRRMAVVARASQVTGLDAEDYQQLRASLSDGGVAWRKLLVYRQSLQQQWLELHRANHRLQAHRPIEFAPPSRLNCAG